jgi:hypothetical protein
MYVSRIMYNLLFWQINAQYVNNNVYFEKYYYL